MIFIFGPTNGVQPKKLTTFELVLTYIQLVFSMGLIGFNFMFALSYPTMTEVPQGLSFILTLIFVFGMMIFVYSILKLYRHWKSEK